MPDKTITIAWTNGSPRFNPPPGVTHLHAGDTVTLQLTGAKGEASIDAVTIYSNQVVNGKNAKGDKLCGWTRSPSANDCTMYDIAPVSETVVKIVDREHPTEDKKYWFSASGSPGDPPWSVDPELVNRPDGGGG